MNIFALVEKDSKRAIAIIESGMVQWFKQNLTTFNIIEVEQVSTTTFNYNEGTISSITIYPKGKCFGREAYHIINKHPEEVNLQEAYNVIFTHYKS